MRTLALILGDQLDPDCHFLRELDPSCDQLWMAELQRESTDIGSHKARVVMFLAAMRHFAQAMKARGWRLHYHSIGSLPQSDDFESALVRDLNELKPEKIAVQEPGDYRVLQLIESASNKTGIPLGIGPDEHFFNSTESFRDYARNRSSVRMEYFYRDLRRKTGILMEGKTPAGNQWNYDTENRRGFPKAGPPQHVSPISFEPDDITAGTIQEVETVLPDLPGSTRHFDWPVTSDQAQQALDDFIIHRLPLFGKFQDAMWQDEPYLFHSRLSAALNLKLLNPRDVIHRAVTAYREGQAPLNSVEGFVRQILGWREYVRGVYWNGMPEYLDRNALGATANLPRFFWTGDTPYHCLRQTITQTMDYGYAHHIQRLMVTGLFTLLLGVEPKQVHRWYLAVYVDAVEWVELPNTLGMSQYADGGVMASKPYIASGKYIQRMSNYCKDCRFNPAHATGETACPYTTLYWDFLIRHEVLLSKNPRMSFQLKNLKRKSSLERNEISSAAIKLKKNLSQA